MKTKFCFYKTCSTEFNKKIFSISSPTLQQELYARYLAVPRLGKLPEDYFSKPSLLYKHTLSLVVKHIGCFRDTGRRAIPQMDGRDILVRDFYRRRVDAIKKCAATAMRRGYRAFSVQHQGWCATGPRAHVTYRKYGRSNRCRNGKGGPWANDVYFIFGKAIFLDISNGISSSSSLLLLLLLHFIPS